MYTDSQNIRPSYVIYVSSENFLFQGGNCMRAALKNGEYYRPMLVLAIDDDSICVVPFTSQCYENGYKKFHCPIPDIEYDYEYSYLSNKNDFACLRDIGKVKNRAHLVIGSVNNTDYLTVLEQLIQLSFEGSEKTGAIYEEYRENIESQIDNLKAKKAKKKIPMPSSPPSGWVQSQSDYYS